MKVMIKAPWESKPHGPYEALENIRGTGLCNVTIDNAIWPVAVDWCTEVQEQKFPDGFPVVRPGSEMMYRWGKGRNHDEYTWPRAPWESAPKNAILWLVLADGTTRWYPGTLEVGDRWLGDSYAYNTEIVHVEERK